MNIPALRAQIGDWTYYVTTLTFEEVSTLVSRIDDELHKSETLKDLIQRSITNNYLSIKHYILNQRELFFNSLVLAVYDDYPDWREIEFTYEGEETYQMGLLQFSSNHKIFPVDGQHRVEGIKAALAESPELKGQRIATIFIGHKNDREGMQRTRRLFSTLNRYAKPVTLDDIIALDEDDTVAIITRFLLEEFDLFTGKRIVIAKQKGIPSNNQEAITSIITLYQANIELFKFFFEERFGTKLTKKKLDEYLKIQPSFEELEAFQEFCVQYWNAFKSNISAVSDFLLRDLNPVQDYRNNETGGNLIFRPIGFLPLVKVSLLIQDRTGDNFVQIFENFDSINLNLDSRPWHFVAWNPKEKKMIMNSDALIQLLLLYLYDESIMEVGEMERLRGLYASKVAPDSDNLDNILNGVR